MSIERFTLDEMVDEHIHKMTVGIHQKLGQDAKKDGWRRHNPRCFFNTYFRPTTLA